MNSYKNIKWACLLAVPLLIVAACTKIDDYKQFTEEGEISYTGKIDSVVVFSGEGRVFIQGVFRSDPKITNCRIYWNNLNDSIDVPVTRTEGVDTLRQFIALPENLYNFQIHTFDGLGNKSVAVYATGRSYGPSYMASINNRLIVSAVANDEDEVTIRWRNIDKTLGAFATEVEYTDNSGEKQRVRVPIDEGTTLLTDYKEGVPFNYETLYLPDTLAIDTFRAEVQSYQTAYRIDRDGWIATADTYEETRQLPNGGPPSFVLDGDPNTYWHTVHSTHTTPFPHWLAFDMGGAVTVSMVELTSRHDYINADFKDFLIEGRNSESEEWVAYGSFNLADVQGSQQFLIAGSPTMRYLRIYQINGGGQPHSHLSEFSVYGNEAE